MDLHTNKKQKLLTVFGLMTGMVVVLVGGVMLWSLSRVTTDDAYVEGRIHNIAAKVPGTVLKLAVDDNQAVRKGDLLVEIDPVDYTVKVNEAQAALDAEKARLNDAQAGIKAALANLEIQDVSARQATSDKQRADALYKEGVMTKERFEKTTTAFRLAFAQAKAAREQVVKARAAQRLEESLVNQRAAALRIAELNLGYTKVLAPSDGYVTSKAVEEGNQIQAGQPLMAVVALDDIWVVANYKETQLKSVKPGQSVRIKVDTYPGYTFMGKVDSIMAGTGAMFSLFPPENALGNYVKVVQRIPVKITFDAMDPARPLRIGMSCVPTVYTKNE